MVGQASAGEVERQAPSASAVEIRVWDMRAFLQTIEAKPANGNVNSKLNLGVIDWRSQPSGAD